MARRNKLVTQSEYARQRGISQPYVHKLIRQGKIPVHPGGIDPREADEARQRNTIVGGRQSMWARQAAPGHPVCRGCGEVYSLEVAKQLDSPDPEKYCSDLCAGAQFTEAELRDFSNLKW